MPSRKKAKGKARRAAKEAKAAVEKEEEGDEEQVALVANQDGSLEAQMRRLTIDDLLRESGVQVQCRHGLQLKSGEEQSCIEFLEAFQEAYGKSIIAGDNNMMANFNAGMKATKEQFASVWKDAEKLRQIVSCYVAEGAQYVLNRRDDDARAVAHFAHFFEEMMQLLLKTQPTIDMQQAYELGWCDMHTLVSFFRKRIPCKCLDKKYKEVKSVTKIGICSNPDCTLPGRKVELKKMLNCSGCNQVCYCSRACQKAHWKEHKEYCRAMSEKIAEFDSKQRPQQC